MTEPPASPTPHALRRALTLLAVTVILGAGAVALAGGLGFKHGWWTLRTGFTTVRWAAYAALGGAALAALALLLPPWRGGLATRFVALAALVLALAMVVVPWRAEQQAAAAPPINDITTDPEDPPPLVALLPLRAGAATPPAYPAAFARIQRESFPDIAPVRMRVPPTTAFAQVRRLAESMGWTIIAAVPDEGRIEAIAQTRWFGFEDDIVLRIRADGDGARVDIRSKARIGRGDRGVNAARVREFLRRLGAARG